MIDAGTIYSALELDASKYEDGIKKAEQRAKSFQSKMQDIGKSMEKVGKEWSKYITAPIVGMGVLATTAAIDYESAFAGVRKTVDATEAKFAELSKSIRDMSKEIPASATAIAGVAEAAGQLGIETDNILSFSRVMIDLGQATNLSADEAATALARFANITQMSQQDFDRLGSAVVDLGNNLATTEAEIVAMGLRLAGAGKQIGLSEAEIMGFAGALSSVGIEAEAGGSAFSKLMVNMQLASETGSTANEVISKTGMSLRDLEMFADADGKSFKELAQSMGLTSVELKGYMSTAKDLDAFAKTTGKSAEDFAKAYRDDATGAIIEFIGGLATAEEKGMSAIAILDDMGITEIRLRDALLRAAGASDVFKESLEIGTRAWEENTALTKEAEERYKTTASQLQISKNYLQDTGITIGEILIPHLVILAERVKDIVTWFSNLGEGTQDTIVKYAALAAAIGPMLVVGSKLLGWFTDVSTAITKAGGVMGMLGKAFTAITGPIGISIAAVAAVTAIVVYLWNTNEDFREAVKKIWDKIRDIFSTVLNDIQTIIAWFVDVAQAFWGRFGDTVLLITDMAWTLIVSTIDAALEMIKGIIDLFGGLFTGDWERMGEGIQRLWSLLWESIKGILSSAWNLLFPSFGGLETNISEWFKNLIDSSLAWGRNMMDMFKKGVTDRITAVTDAVKNVGEKIKSFLGFSSPTKEGLLSDADNWMPNMMGMFEEGIEKNTGKVAGAGENVAKQIGNSLGSVDVYVSNTVKGIEKQFQLWALQNNVVKDSSEYLSEQLEVQRQKHEVLNGQIQATELALTKISEEYGEGSNQALEYRNKLLDLMIAQEGLKKSVDETTTAIERQSKVALSGQSSSDITSRYMADYINRTADAGVAFGQAPKFHDGGWVGGIKGKKFDELMALLQTGEFVVSKKMVDNYEKSASATSASQIDAGRGGDIHQHIIINSPEPLTPSEIARRTLQSSRQLAMEWGF